MRTSNRGVHRQRPINQARRVCCCRDHRRYPIPRPIERHPPMPRPHRLPWPEHRRQIPPCEASPVPVDDALDHRPRIRELPTRTPRRTWQHRLDQRPLSIRKHLKTRHAFRLAASHPNLCQTRPRHAVFPVSPVDLRWGAGALQGRRGQGRSVRCVRARRHAPLRPRALASTVCPVTAAHGDQPLSATLTARILRPHAGSRPGVSFNVRHSSSPARSRQHPRIFRRQEWRP